MFDLKSHNKTKARRPDPDESVFSDRIRRWQWRTGPLSGGPPLVFWESPLGGRGVCPSPHLGLDALEGLLQQQWEAPHLPLEPVVVVGEGPQRRLQRQQVGPDTCEDRRGVKPAGRGASVWGRPGPSRPAHLPGSRARPSFPPGLWRRPPRRPGSCPPPGTASPPASARVPAPAPTRTWRSGSRGQKLNT